MFVISAVVIILVFYLLKTGEPCDYFMTLIGLIAYEITDSIWITCVIMFLMTLRLEFNRHKRH